MRPLSTVHLLLLSLIAYPPIGQACSCDWFTAFCEEAVHGTLLHVETISQATLSTSGSFEQPYTLFKIRWNNQETVTLPDTIAVLHDNDGLCMENFGELFPTQEMILGLSPNVEQSRVVGEEFTNVPAYPMYQVGGCGNFALFVDGDRLGGNNLREVSLADFLDDPNNNCPTPIVDTNQKLPPLPVRVGPNPLVEEVTFSNRSNQALPLSLYNMNGQVMQQFSLAPYQIATLRLNTLPVGAYYLRDDLGMFGRGQMLVVQ